MDYGKTMENMLFLLQNIVYLFVLFIMSSTMVATMVPSIGGKEFVLVLLYMFQKVEQLAWTTIMSEERKAFLEFRF